MVVIGGKYKRGGVTEVHWFNTGIYIYIFVIYLFIVELLFGWLEYKITLFVSYISEMMAWWVPTIEGVEPTNRYGNYNLCPSSFRIACQYNR